MKISHILAACLGAALYAISAISTAFEFARVQIHDFGHAMLRADHGAFRLAPAFRLLAYRVISALTPVYRESYLTNGLCLAATSLRV